MWIEYLDKRFQLLWNRLYIKSCTAYRKVDLNLKRYTWEPRHPGGFQRCSFAAELNEVKYVFSNLILYAAPTFQYTSPSHRVSTLNRRNILIVLYIFTFITGTKDEVRIGKHIYTCVFFREVAYMRCDVPWFVESMDFTSRWLTLVPMLDVI